MDYYHFEVVFPYHSSEFALHWVQTILGFGSRQHHPLIQRHFCRRNTKVQKLHIVQKVLVSATAAKLLSVLETSSDAVAGSGHRCSFIWEEEELTSCIISGVLLH